MEGAPFESIVVASLASGGIILCGAVYALAYAAARRGANRHLIRIGVVAYAALVVCTFVLCAALDFDGVWLALAACLLIGYLLAPPFDVETIRGGA